MAQPLCSKRPTAGSGFPSGHSSLSRDKNSSTHRQTISKCSSCVWCMQRKQIIELHSAYTMWFAVQIVTIEYITRRFSFGILFEWRKIVVTNTRVSLSQSSRPTKSMFEFLFLFRSLFLLDTEQMHLWHLHYFQFGWLSICKPRKFVVFTSWSLYCICILIIGLLMVTNFIKFLLSKLTGKLISYKQFVHDCKVVW